MKNPTTIFKHLYSHHPKFWQSRCFRKILSLLPPRFKDHILYLYQKNGTLYFVFNHPAFAMEFNYNKKPINDILKLAKEKIEECQILTFTHIKGYHKFVAPQEPYSPPPLQQYKEQAQGEFTIYTTDEKLSTLLAHIKDQIKKNASSANN